MKAFIRDMLIGWILYTESGKRFANKVVNYTYKQVKESLASNTDKEQKPNKQEYRNNNDKQQFNNRTKN